jgi:hypothetical protein
MGTEKKYSPTKGYLMPGPGSYGTVKSSLRGNASINTSKRGDIWNI